MIARHPERGSLVDRVRTGPGEAPRYTPSALERGWTALRNRIKPLSDPFLSARDMGLAARSDFQRVRESARYLAAYDKPEPLVSICIATYNRALLLGERALRSALAQSYPNIEIVVVGDGCTDETAAMMAQVTDERVRFVNLERRGDYPQNPRLRWMVAGTAAMNQALSMARGDFITHLDDDDEHEPERVEALLAHIRRTRADLVYHPFRYETPEGDWSVNQAGSFRMGRVTTSSIFYHNHFRMLGWDPLAYRYREPGDWNRLRKIAFLGARRVRHPGLFLSHYRERNQQGGA